MKVVVISVHNLSEKNKRDLSYLIGEKLEDLKFISIFYLKHSMGIREIICEIFSQRNDKIVLSLLGENVLFLKSILFGLSLFTFSYNYKVIDISGVRSRSFLYVLFGACYSLFGFIRNKFLVKVIVKKIKKISTERRTTNLNGFQEIEYLKTNLWFGTKAGGSIGHISGIVNSLNKIHKVNYHTCEEPIMIDESVKINYVDTHDISYSIPYELNQLQIANAFYKHLKKQACVEAVYQRLTIYNYAGALYCSEKKIPFILEYNGSEVWIQTNWSQGLKYPKLAQKIEDFCLSSADVIVTISKELEKDLILRGVDKNKIVTYPNCIDPHRYNLNSIGQGEQDEVRESLGFSRGDLIYTFIGTFGLWHGVVFLAETIKMLVDNHEDELLKNKIKFLLVGDGIYAAEVRSMLNGDKYSQFVQFTGLVPQAEAPKYLSISSVFLSPHTRREGEVFFGSPTKLFEYMAYSKPIIASSLYQLEEVFRVPLHIGNTDIASVTQDTDGFLFEPNNHLQLCNLILEVASEYEKLKHVGENATENVLSNYTWDIHVAKILEKLGYITI